MTTLETIVSGMGDLQQILLSMLGIGLGIGVGVFAVRAGWRLLRSLIEGEPHWSDGMSWDNPYAAEDAADER